MSTTVVTDIISQEPPSAATVVPVKVVRASRGWIPLNLRDIWEYRDLLLFIAWRDVVVRYKQTLLGVVWAILQPVLAMIVFTVFFGRLGKLPSDGIPYPIFSFCALLPWQLFERAMTASGNSLIANQQLITKVYFPRLIIPVAPVLSALVDFVIAFAILGLMMVYYGINPGWSILAVIPLSMMAVATSLAVALWLSALNALYRDVRYTIPFLSQLWMFLTPVAYSSHIVPEAWRGWYSLNPMVGVVDGFRWALLGQPGGVGGPFYVSVLMVGVLLVGGLYYFRRMERYFSDWI